MAQRNATNSSNADLIELARSLTAANGSLKIEPTYRRVRGQFDTHWLFDTTSAYHVWEHPYYPQYYVPLAAIEGYWIVREEAVDHDAWYEEDQPIYGHPKDPYKRIDILPSSRRITIKVGGVVVAESTLNMFLFETMLRTRYYMPKTASKPCFILLATYDVGSAAVIEADMVQIKWQYTTASSTMSLCPYKGTAEYYNLNVNGTEIKNALWWYRYPTHESAPIAGMACFYNEKVDVFVDGVKEEK
ncbi:MAG: hypothetical protein Q9212_001021 [Teloschistes hypoglaucus]